MGETAFGRLLLRVLEDAAAEPPVWNGVWNDRKAPESAGAFSFCRSGLTASYSAATGMAMLPESLPSATRSSTAPPSPARTTASAWP